MTLDDAPGSTVRIREDDAKWRIDRALPLPIYAQIRQRLLAEILAWPADNPRFYTERELAGHFGVNHLTVRQAFADLVAEGYLRRERGRGTFVARRVFEERLSSEMDIERQYEMTGTPAEVQLLDFRREPAADETASRLNIRVGTEILRFRRLRSVTGIPLAIDDRALLTGVAESVRFDETVAAGRIVDHLRDRGAAVRGDWQIAARLPTIEETGLLHLTEGQPVLERAMVYFDASGRPILTGSSVHRADMARYRLSLDLASPGGPAEDG